MRLAVAQFRPAFMDVSVNVDHIVRVIHATDADVIVMPELATSGYFFLSRAEAQRVAEPLDGPSISAIREAAEATGRVVVCGLPEADGDRLFNSAAIIVPGMPTRVYRKTHLFYKERQCFDAGDTGFFVVDLPHLDCRLGTMICYDWRFPEAARTLALRGADVIACPSNLVTNIWRMAMPVRALENKVYLAVANRTGTETNGGEEVIFNGDSVIYGYNGSVMASANGLDDAVLTAEVDPAATRSKSFNVVNDIFADRRPEHYA